MHSADKEQHYNDVIMSVMASQITSFMIVYSGADQRKHQSSASLAFVRGIHRGPVNSSHEWPVMPQSHPTTGPVRFLTPVRFIARKAEWSARRNFTPVLLSWSHQATGPVRLDTAVHLCFDQIILRIHMDPVRCPYGRRTGPARESQMFFISYGARAGPARVPYGSLSGT